MTKIEEIWKDVVGYEFYYQVSNHGNVRRVGGNIMRLSKQPKSDRPEDYYL